MILGRALSREEVLVVGDTPHDIEGAHGADSLGVGVATGHYSKDELSAAGADYVLGTLEEELPL
jgi:phosphoglycolate phosphatase-like HAD superfamily hydrolase